MDRWRLHWTWRWLIATGVLSGVAKISDSLIHQSVQGAVNQLAIAIGLEGAEHGPDWTMVVPGPYYGGRSAALLTWLWWHLPPVTWGLCAALAAIGTYRLLTGAPGPPADGNTRCGRCHYILKGLTEPRCPECGHNI